MVTVMEVKVERKYMGEGKVEGGKRFSHGNCPFWNT